MFFRELYDQSLAQASYVIGCQATGEAIVIDPLRDPAPYLEVARAEGLRITHVTETHIHADFVSGARELRAASGARLYLSAEGGADWQYAFAAEDDAVLLHDGDRIMVGNIALDVLHTPGHTPEHLSFVVTDTPRAAGPMGIVTGDFVFVGDVGRPDLLERAAGLADTMEAGARTLFRSLQRFRTLPDHLQIWPGHGAGSACGKALGAVPSSTVGYEKRANWGVAATDEAAFVAAVLEGQPEPPRYFAAMKRINRDGPPIIGGAPAMPTLTADAVLAPARDDRWVIDLRRADAFAAGHLEGSLSVPFSKSFSTWIGSIIPVEHELILMAPAGESGGPPAAVTQAARDLFRIGFDRITGWVDAADALAAWQRDGRPLHAALQYPVDSLAARMAGATAITIVDVRGRTEWDAGHLPGATHIPLGDLRQRAAELPAGPLYVHCQSGARSAVATSLLHRLGRSDAIDVQGGFAAWLSGEFPTVGRSG
ncbi:MAG: MBL fold metallo-hydrolase [Gemmatimonadota bacterium]|nr:MBL fold metallo-hydrolase [Gemmatimonadota bacterium]MDQ8173023.1 MBL fold metallo-hydrolase [Gemmatimonadota bacterium]